MAIMPSVVALLSSSVTNCKVGVTVQFSILLLPSCCAYGINYLRQVNKVNWWSVGISLKELGVRCRSV